MNNNNIQNKVIDYNDLKISLGLFFDYLKKHKELSFENLGKIREEEIKLLNLSEKEEEKAIKSSKDIHRKVLKNQIRTFVLTYLTNKIIGSQIKIDNTFDFVDETLEKIKSDFGFEFSPEDKFETAIEVLKAVDAAVTTYATWNYDEKEKELIEAKNEEFKQNLKHNRAFGRDTKQINSLEKK